MEQRREWLARPTLAATLVSGVVRGLEGSQVLLTLFPLISLLGMLEAPLLLALLDTFSDSVSPVVKVLYIVQSTLSKTDTIGTGTNCLS